MVSLKRLRLRVHDTDYIYTTMVQVSTSEIKTRNGVSANSVIGRDTNNNHALSKYDIRLDVGQPTITESKVRVAVCLKIGFKLLLII